MAQELEYEGTMVCVSAVVLGQRLQLPDIADELLGARNPLIL